MWFRVKSIKNCSCTVYRAALRGALIWTIVWSHFSFGQEQTLPQMVHTSWTARDGAPQDIKALAQAHDGTLWIGTPAGLFNFDGLTFTAFRSPPGQPDLPSPSVKSLLVASDGALWVGMRIAGAARIFNGQVTLYNKFNNGKLVAQILNLREAPDGRIMAIANNDELVSLLQNGEVHIEAYPAGVESHQVRGFFFDSQGSLWEQDDKYLYKKQAGQSRFKVTEVKTGIPLDFAEMADGTLWMTDFDPEVALGRREHFDRDGHLLSSVYDSEMVYANLPLPDGSMLMSTHYEGLRRVRWRDREAFKGPAGAEAETFRQTDGLSSDFVEALFRDREGNIWSGGLKGLDRFTVARLVRFVPPAPTRTSHSSDWQVCTNSVGEVWIGNTDKQLYVVRNGSVNSVSRNLEPSKIFCGRQGDVWVVTLPGVLKIRYSSHTQLPAYPGWVPKGLRAMAEAGDGGLLASGIGGVQTIRKLKGDSWTKLITDHPLPDVAQAILADSEGKIWIASARAVWVLEGEHLRKIAAVPSDYGVIQTLAETSHGILIATTNGLMCVQHASLRRLAFEDSHLTQGLTGAVEARNGDVWLNGSRGIVRVSSVELRAALQDERYHVRADNVTEGEFIGPASLTVQMPSASIDATGKLWFATINGVVSFDPSRQPVAMSLPLLAITSITADQHQLDAKGSFGPRLQVLDIRYRGINLTAPEKVTYKYKLDGVDKTWQSVEHRSQAIYTQLRPGKYTFHVMASNGNQMWTPVVSSQTFEVRPMFYQTWWFALFEVLVSLSLLRIVLVARMKRAAHAVRVRAEERADERIRIARELHDTLLQGVQGLLMNFHVAAQKIPESEESRRMLDKALSSADRLIVEGRSRVNDLRSERFSDQELLRALELVAQDLNVTSRVGCKVVRVGNVRPLQQHIAAEVFYIGREALTNAFRHAQASEITLELRYEARVFTLSCRDNGVGFQPNKNGMADRQGHWGLRGMAERAAKMGAQFRCKSEPSMGTEIVIVFPNDRAYERKSRIGSLLSEFNWGRDQDRSHTEG